MSNEPAVDEDFYETIEIEEAEPVSEEEVSAKKSGGSLAGGLFKRRHDHEPATAKKRERKQRDPKRRHDSIVTRAIDGWGNPLQVKVKPGWIAYWVSASDAVRFSFRPWVMASFGDPRIVSCEGVATLEKGKPIQYKELTLYLMRKEDHDRLNKADPYRQRQQLLRTALFKKAEESEANGQKGFVKRIERDIAR